MSVTKGWTKVTVLAAFLAALLLGAFMFAPAAHAKGGDGTRIQLRGSAQYPNANGTAKSSASPTTKTSASPTKKSSATPTKSPSTGSDDLSDACAYHPQA